jgi:hypothetical protein
MATITLAQYIITIRALVSDLGTGRASTMRGEIPSGIMDGSNKRLQIQRYPVVDTSFVLRKNQVVIADPADYGIDLDTGIITLVVAGDFNTERFDCDYRFLWYADSDYHEFIHAAGGHVGITGDGADAAARAQSVLTHSTDCLLDAIRQFAGYHFNIRRAQEFADKYNASAGGVSVNVDVVTKNFRELAKAFFDRGIQMRDDCYKDHGKRDQPAANIRNFSGVGRYQPRR